jgi:phage shock protein A
MFSRISNLIRGFFSLFITGLEKQNPEALLELEQENLRKQIASYNQGLAAHAGLAERLIGQVRKLETEEKELRARTAAHLRAGNKGGGTARAATADRDPRTGRKPRPDGSGRDHLQGPDPCA